jgi:hypothetical protein
MHTVQIYKEVETAVTILIQCTVCLLMTTLSLIFMPPLLEFTHIYIKNSKYLAVGVDSAHSTRQWRATQKSAQCRLSSPPPFCLNADLFNSGSVKEFFNFSIFIKAAQ